MLWIGLWEIAFYRGLREYLGRVNGHTYSSKDPIKSTLILHIHDLFTRIFFTEYSGDFISEYFLIYSVCKFDLKNTCSSSSKMTTAFQKIPLNVPRAVVEQKIQSLITNLVGIQDTSGEFLLHLEDGSIVDTKGWNDWEWTHGIGLYGLWMYYEMTKDARSLEIIKAWFNDRFAEPPRHKNINTMAVFLTLAYLYEHTHDRRYLPHLDSWGEWAMHDLARTQYGGMQHVTYLTPNTQQLWDDTLMMTVLPLAKIGKLLNRPHYIDEAKRQFLIHIKYLFSTKTGLFYHAWTFEGGGHNFANAYWGRGNSWLTIVIPEFIELLELQPTDPIRLHLIDTLTAQISGLEKYQDKVSGLWRTILDQESYLEASATAGFAFGILKAIRKRYISRNYADVALKAVRGVLNKINESGELESVSFGTPVFNSIQEYKDIPLTSMPYGQAMAMMCLVEFLRLYI
ncbi:Six-hairpin glycosidase-like protein [Dichotomocladium elegans]|nr:Six-hairpin glycosidase-like protein [Dichotomocladium elegans]